MEQWQEIRGGIEKNLGKRVWMKSHRGRSKCVENVGILEHSFPSIFTILIEEHGQEKRIYAFMLKNSRETGGEWRRTQRFFKISGKIKCEKS